MKVVTYDQEHELSAKDEAIVSIADASMLDVLLSAIGGLGLATRLLKDCHSNIMRIQLNQNNPYYMYMARLNMLLSRTTPTITLEDSQIELVPDLLPTEETSWDRHRDTGIDISKM